MANNKVFEDGWHLSVACTDPAAPSAGDPVRYGLLTGVALTDESGGLNATGETTVDFGPGVWDIPVTDEVGGGIAASDAIFYDDALDGLTNDPSGNYFFGFANEAVGIGLTATIQVIHVPSPGAGMLGAGTIATANLAAGILSANAAGRALFAAGVFDVATALSVFAANSIANAFLLDAVADGAFAADAATRALFADDFLTGDKLGAGVIVQEVVAGQDETADDTIPVTGLAAGDELVGVIVVAAGVPTQHVNADFTVGAGNLTVTANKANNAANAYIITWIDKTP